MKNLRVLFALTFQSSQPEILDEIKAIIIEAQTDMSASNTETPKTKTEDNINGKLIVSKCPNLASRFRGCMLGSLMGDCLGQPFEGEERPISKSVLNSYFEKLHDSNLKCKFHCLASSSTKVF